MTIVVAPSEIRLLLAPCRSGTTILLRALCQHPMVAGFYQIIKESFRRNGVPDYSPFDRDSPLRRNANYRDRLILLKETLGPNNQAESELAVFPDKRSLVTARPVFVFRDPRAVYSSWKRNQIGDVDLFIKAYRRVHADYLLVLELAGPGACLPLVYEQLVASPRRGLETICALWGIEMSEEVLAFRKSLAASIENEVDPELADDREAYDGLHLLTESSTRFENRPVSFDNMLPNEVGRIESALLDIYHELAS